VNFPPFLGGVTPLFMSAYILVTCMYKYIHRYIHIGRMSAAITECVSADVVSASRGTAGTHVSNAR
jgi:hypothetical protein